MTSNDKNLSNQEVCCKEKKEVLSSNVIFGILSVIFSQLSGYFYAGLVTGIIGIIKGVRCRKKTQLPLALSIIGTVFSVINILSNLLAITFLVFYYLFYFFMIIVKIGSTY